MLKIININRGCKSPLFKKTIMNKIINILVPIACFTLVSVIVLFIAILPSLIDNILAI